MNRTDATLLSSPPHPVLVALSWTDGSHEVAARRLALPSPVLPNASLTFDVTIEAPDAAGVYELRAALVQEWVAWFAGDVGDASARITVGARTAARFAGAQAAFARRAS
jgi:hypothetical protein